MLAATGGDGLLEVDVSANPLVEHLAAPGYSLRESPFKLPSTEGIGFDPDRRILSDIGTQSEITV